MELLHIMIFGATTNVPLTRWYLIFEKVVDTIDECKSNISHFRFLFKNIFLYEKKIVNFSFAKSR